MMMHHSQRCESDDDASFPAVRIRLWAPHLESLEASVCLASNSARSYAWIRSLARSMCT